MAHFAKWLVTGSWRFALSSWAACHGGGQGAMGQDGCGQHTVSSLQTPHVGWQWSMAGCVTTVLSVQILYAKQGLRVRRRLTRDNVKEKVKETRRILAKIRFVAKEVQRLLGNPFSELERVGKESILSCLLGLSPV